MYFIGVEIGCAMYFIGEAIGCVMYYNKQMKKYAFKIIINITE